VALKVENIESSDIAERLAVFRDRLADRARIVDVATDVVER
jgi:hypothetical protein